MKKVTKKIIKLSINEILNNFIDLGVVVDGIFTRSYSRKISIKKYFGKRAVDKIDLSKKIYYLKKIGLIKQFYQAKELHLEITKKGFQKLQKIVVDNLNIKRPKKWDGKWRIVIFDIPEKERTLRNAIRNKLHNLGFWQVQKSVFIYPFECNKEINVICNIFGGRKYLKYLIADIIEGEEEIINKFVNLEVLQKSDLKTS
jgi:DNA-binding transcriptional regulator PaaX